jgi:hypothetical protein
MAYNARTLTRMASTPVDTTSRNCDVFFHATDDAAATVTAAGYYDLERDTLKVNDLIFVMAVHNGVGDWLVLKVLTVPAAPGNITTAINNSAVGT